MRFTIIRQNLCTNAAHNMMQKAYVLALLCPPFARHSIRFAEQYAVFGNAICRLLDCERPVFTTGYACLAVTNDA